jgi:hypothetical protein
MVTRFSNDDVKTIKGSATLREADGTTTRFAAGDTFVASKDGGDLSQLVSSVREVVELMKKSGKGKQEAVLNVDGEALARAVYKRVDPVLA